MKINLYNDNIGFVTDEVSIVPTNIANTSEASRERFVTDLAAVSRGKTESNNPEVRFRHLLREAAPTLYTQTVTRSMSRSQVPVDKTPSRPLEFLPIVTDIRMEDNIVQLRLSTKWLGIPLEVFINRIARYSYLEGSKLYTNARCLINAGISYDGLPYNTAEELKHFKAFRAKIPMFVWSQFMTHTQLSKESQSDRVTTTYDYWLPEDFNARLETERDTLMKTDLAFAVVRLGDNPDRSSILNLLLNVLPQTTAQKFLSALGYPKEITNRAPYYFKYKEVVFTAWANNPDTFNHFLLERSAYPDLHKNWTQKEMKIFAEALARFFPRP